MCAASGSDDRTSDSRLPASVRNLTAARTAAAREGAGDGAASAVDARVEAAWRSWLSALARDAEAAIAAAMAYASLPPEAREAWLDALEADREALDVPRVALYAPLLAVEGDEPRRARMIEALRRDDAPPAPSPRMVTALHGTTATGQSVCAVLSPLYLDFVELLVCRYDADVGIACARHDPLRHVEDAPCAPGVHVEGATLDAAPLRMVVEELAHAVVADRRAGRAAPPELARFIHLFGPDLEGAR